MWKTTATLLRETIDTLREQLDAVRLDHAASSARAETLERALAVAQTNFEWARLRLNQLEAERSALLTSLLKVPLAPLTIERATPTSAPGSGVAFDGIHFEDVGDAMADRLGIQHDGDGSVKYRS